MQSTQENVADMSEAEYKPEVHMVQAVTFADTVENLPVSHCVHSDWAELGW
jgi:hypothetical protein